MNDWKSRKRLQIKKQKNFVLRRLEGAMQQKLDNMREIHCPLPCGEKIESRRQDGRAERIAIIERSRYNCFLCVSHKQRDAIGSIGLGNNKARLPELPGRRNGG